MAPAARADLRPRGAAGVSPAGTNPCRPWNLPAVPLLFRDLAFDHGLGTREPGPVHRPWELPLRVAQYGRRLLWSRRQHFPIYRDHDRIQVRPRAGDGALAEPGLPLPALRTGSPASSLHHPDGTQLRGLEVDVRPHL